ncbi:YafY family protein [Methylocapsa sp. S129]|uniref:helix-turn-helix transcriptional regulator n=1 Tax=Methylocapsa sp. S129 TaxID=1641869 RepID=UPI00131E7938|nr:YafY family protein [Methylocapsa sp. S129]
MARTTRLLELLQILRGKTQPVTAASLAAELGVSERTLYRDVAELSAQGAPIYGEAGVGYVLRPGLFLPPLMLSDDETEAVVLGLRYVDQRGDGALREAAARASAKIAAILSTAAKEAMLSPISLPGPRGRGYPDNAVPLTAFRAAIRAQAKLRIAYQAANGASTERIVWPLALGFTNEARVLLAWCEMRQAYRMFRTDRIGSAEETGGLYPGRRGQLVRKWRSQMNRDQAGEFTPDRN